MTKISQIYDLLLDTIKGELPNHRELSNPYFPETSDDLTYEAAIGLGFGAGQNTFGNINANIQTLTRDFILSICRKQYITHRATALRASTEKALMEDLQLVLRKLEEDSHLGEPALIADARYQNDGGVEFVRVERDDLIIIRANISVEYHVN